MSADVRRFTVDIFMQMVPLEGRFLVIFCLTREQVGIRPSACSSREKLFMRTVALGGRLLRDLWVVAYSIKQNSQRILASVRDENGENDSLISEFND
jgi:hypothetical protein